MTPSPALQYPSPRQDQRMNEPTPKSLIIALPAHERGRSADELKRLDVLNRRIAKPLPKGDKRAF